METRQDFCVGNVSESNSDEEFNPEYIDRPTSAPPSLEINRGFMSVMDSISLFNLDIRSHPMYEKFYNQVNDPTLPPPLTFLKQWQDVGPSSNSEIYSLFDEVCTCFNF